ncbi:P-loop containing nucleoside triphosphate hydrolase protein [Syncephalis plumigaleata]|nr:P-loop containing nucleoside triphosphate hydrolase protein [Syncephalis plumigaleata]
MVTQRTPAKADWQESFTKRQVGVADLTLLSKVSENTINDNLKQRFENGEIYTYIGYVLISVNPFRDLGIYTDEILQHYIGKNILEVPPHVFAIAENAYFKMHSYKENQCVIISGESGAGKTEAAKKIMQYIASVSGGQGSSSIQEIKDMVLATNPLLESFGCAKTLRNNNSSRHGKYLEILFNGQREPIGARITNYLLEKARVVGQIKNERNFHIFYQFTKGAAQEYRDHLGITGPEGYNYTYGAGCLDVDGIDDVVDYADTLRAMQVIGLTKTEQDNIHKMLAIILWLGNITFEEGDNDSSKIVDPNVSAYVANLMQVTPELLEKALINRTIETQRGGRRGSMYDVPLNPIQASIYALSKAIYDRMFEWIVTRINLAMKERSKSEYIIGVLDIYGFEIFELQQIFIQLTLKTEQEEYVQEKIQWTPIEYFNNKIVCDLIEERRPPGVFAAMNDACATAHADSSAADNSLVQRLGGCAANAHFQLRGQQFLVRHYAGDVSYDIKGMTDKNKDQLVRDILDLIESSQQSYLKELFPEKIDRDSKKRPPTASDKIKTSAAALPNEYDQQMTMHQIKYLGLKENVRIRRAGFASRQTFEKFLERFYLLSPKTSYAGEYIWRGDAKSGCEQILRDVSINKEEWQMGVTKCFIRHPETLWALEHLRERYWHNMAMRIQRAFRNYMRYKHECARRIQRCFRKNKDQLAYIRLRDYGHQVLAGRKERRRFSLISMRRYYGDYLAVGGRDENGEAIRSICGISAQERVAFSTRGQILAARALRSSKPSPRIIVQTSSAVYIVVTKLENKLPVMRVERKIPLINIRGISLSTLQDDTMVIHLKDTTTEIDLVLFTSFKTEMVACLLQYTHGSIAVEITPQITYVKKAGGKTEVLKFVKNEAIGIHETYKSHVVSVATGQPVTSVSDPPCARNDAPARPITTGKLLRAGGPGGPAAPSTPKRRPAPAPAPPKPTPTATTTPGVMPNLPPRPNGIPSSGASPPPAPPVPTAAAPTATTSATEPAPPKPAPKVNSNMDAVVAAMAAPTATSTTASPPPPTSTSTTSTTSPPPRSLPPPPSAALPPIPSVPQGEVLYDFTPEDTNELSLTKGLKVEIIEKNDNGWWLVKYDGKEGWAPSNYLKEIKAAPPSRPPPPPTRRPMPAPPMETSSPPSAASAASASPSPSISSPSMATSPIPSVTDTKVESEVEPVAEPIRIIPVATTTTTNNNDTNDEAEIPAWKKELAARKAAKGNTMSRTSTIATAEVTLTEEGKSQTIGPGATAGGNRSVAKLAAMFAHAQTGQPPVMGMLRPGMKPPVPVAGKEDENNQNEEEDSDWD